MKEITNWKLVFISTCGNSLQVNENCVTGRQWNHIENRSFTNDSVYTSIIITVLLLLLKIGVENSIKDLSFIFFTFSAVLRNFCHFSMYLGICWNLFYESWQWGSDWINFSLIAGNVSVFFIFFRSLDELDKETHICTIKF